MRRIFLALLLPALLFGDIDKFDEEDMRELRSADPYIALTFPPLYAFIQAVKLAQREHLPYFSLLGYDFVLGKSKTSGRTSPPSFSGTYREYADEWVRVEILGYFDPPEGIEVFETARYEVSLGDDADD